MLRGNTGGLAVNVNRPVGAARRYACRDLVAGSPPRVQIRWRRTVASYRALAAMTATRTRLLLLLLLPFFYRPILRF